MGLEGRGGRGGVLEGTDAMGGGTSAGLGS